MPFALTIRPFLTAHPDIRFRGMEAEMAESWGMANQAIEAYTGLSPVIFYPLLTIIWFLINIVGFLMLLRWHEEPSPPPPPPLRKREKKPLPPPLQLGEITEEELREYGGSDPKKPLLMAIKGQIYDVTLSRIVYGPGGTFALFAGKDASRGWAKLSFKPKDLTSDLSGLLPLELEALQDFENMFTRNYAKVGTVKKTVPVTDSSGCDASVVTENSTMEDEPTAETAGSCELHAETDNDDHTSSDLNTEPTEKDVKSARDHGAVEQPEASENSPTWN